MTETPSPNIPQFIEPAPVTEWPESVNLPRVVAAWEDDGGIPLDAPDDPPPGPYGAPERDGEAVAATPTAAPPRPDAQPRKPLAAGTYALYEDGNGGVVLVLGTADGETHHKHIPAKMVKMGEMMMGGGGPLAALGGLFGGR